MGSRQGMTGKIHLGDGVFVEIDRGMVKLTTEAGDEPINTIVMSSNVYFSLVDVMRQLRHHDHAPRRSP
jgi:hypothetical protein